MTTINTQLSSLSPALLFSIVFLSAIMVPILFWMRAKSGMKDWQHKTKNAIKLFHSLLSELSSSDSCSTCLAKIDAYLKSSGQWQTEKNELESSLILTVDEKNNIRKTSTILTTNDVTAASKGANNFFSRRFDNIYTANRFLEKNKVSYFGGIVSSGSLGSLFSFFAAMAGNIGSENTATLAYLGVLSLIPFILSQFLQHNWNELVNTREREVKKAFQEVSAAISTALPSKNIDNFFLQELANLQTNVTQKFLKSEENQQNFKLEITKTIQKENSLISDIINQQAERVVFSLSQINPILKNFESTVVVNLEHMEEQIKTLSDNLELLDGSTKKLIQEVKIDLSQSIQNSSADVVMDIAGEMKQVIQKLKEMTQAEWKTNVGETTLKALLKLNLENTKECTDRGLQRLSKKLIEETQLAKSQLEESILSVSADLHVAKAELGSQVSSEMESLRFNLDSTQELASSAEAETLRTLSIEMRELNNMNIENIVPKIREISNSLVPEIKELSESILPQLHQLVLAQHQLKESMPNSYQVEKKLDLTIEKTDQLLQQMKFSIEEATKESNKEYKALSQKVETQLEKNLHKNLQADIQKHFEKSLEANLSALAHELEHVQKQILKEVQSVGEYLEEVPISAVQVSQKSSRKKPSQSAKKVAS